MDGIEVLKIKNEGLESTLRLTRISLARMEVARYTAERNLASEQLDRSKLQLVLCKRASETGIAQMPLCAEAAERYFENDK